MVSRRCNIVQDTGMSCFRLCFPKPILIASGVGADVPHGHFAMESGMQLLLDVYGTELI